MSRDSMMFYRSWAEMIKQFPKTQQLASLWAVIDYGLDGKECEAGGLAAAAFLSARRQIDANNRRYENAKKGGAPAGNQNAKKQPKNNLIEVAIQPKNNQKTTKKQPNDNANDNVNDNVNVKNFIRPTLEQVREYCLERRNGIDPQSFIDFYAARGWKLTKGVSMKDWKAAVRNWETRRRQQPGKYNNAPERSYDMDELEKWLLATN